MRFSFSKHRAQLGGPEEERGAMGVLFFVVVAPGGFPWPRARVRYGVVLFCLWVLLLHLADSRGPQEEDPRDADEQRHHRHRPRHGEGVLATLVGDVVHDVQKVPGAEQGA
eukprot:scaffold20500_cov56-Isochrysis_galbana.AAC.1